MGPETGRPVPGPWAPPDGPLVWIFGWAGTQVCGHWIGSFQDKAEAGISPGVHCSGRQV